MDAIKAFTDCNRCDLRHHCEAPKRSRDKLLKHNEEGRGNQPQSHKAALPMNTTRALWGHCEYHNNTHPMTTIIITGASIAATQERRMQKGDTPRGKPQADWANSCLRLPVTNAGSTTKHTPTTKSHHDTYATCHAWRSLDRPLIKSPDRASDTVPSDDRTSESDVNKNYHFVSNPKIKRMFVVWCSSLATATLSLVQSANYILYGFSRQGCLDSKLDVQILLRHLLTSLPKISVWFW
jgi:hypothetical protein